MVNKTIKDRVDAKIEWCKKQIFERYGKKVRIRSVSYTLKGRHAGQADYINGHIYFNAHFLNAHTDHFIENVVVHEFAHVAHEVLHPEDLSQTTGYRKGHGKNWKRIMRELGAEPNTYHNYDISHLMKNVSYMCTCCGETLKVNQDIHSKVLRNPKKYKLEHIECSSPLIFVGL